MRNFATLRSIVFIVQMEVLKHAFLSSHPHYCNSLFTSLNNTSVNLAKVRRNSAAKSSRGSHATLILITLQSLPTKFLLNVSWSDIYCSHIIPVGIWGCLIRVCWLFFAPGFTPRLKESVLWGWISKTLDFFPVGHHQAVHNHFFKPALV